MSEISIQGRKREVVVHASKHGCSCVIRCWNDGEKDQVTFFFDNFFDLHEFPRMIRRATQEMMEATNYGMDV